MKGLHEYGDVQFDRKSSKASIAKFVNRSEPHKREDTDVFCLKADDIIIKSSNVSDATGTVADVA
jgi:hypothetical protein